MVRVREWKPAPQEVVQVDQAPKTPGVQSTGHAKELHERISPECGQALPPNAGATKVRLRCCDPVPHDFVQVDQAVQDSTVQSTAHAWVLQARVSAECGHAAPPNVGWTVARLRFCDPVPHDFVQVDQTVQAGVTQSMGHAWVLQARVSAECGHAMPPCLGAMLIRLRRCEPVPQDTVHMDQAPKLLTLQSTAHANSLQSRVSLR